MFDRASKIEKVFRRYPRAPIFARLAEQLLRRGRLQRAQSLCEEGCQRFPAYPTGFIVLSRCFARQKLWEEARSALDRALRLDPDNPAGYQRLAGVYRELKNDTLALKCLERAAALDPLSKSLRDELELMSRSLRRPPQRQPEPEPKPVPAPLPTPAPDAPPVAQTAPVPAGDALESVEEGDQTEVEVGADEPGVDDTAFKEPEVDERPVDDMAVETAPVQPESETVADVEAEPFAQVAPQPEWDEPEAVVEAEPEAPLTVDVETSPAGADVADDLVPDTSMADNPVPEDDVVAALGAGLFDDEDPPAAEQPPPLAHKPVRPPPARDPAPIEDVRPNTAEPVAAEPAPAEPTAAPPVAPKPVASQPVVPEARPVPVELLDDVEPVESATTEPTGAAQLTRRRGTELAELLREFGDDTQRPVEPDDAPEADDAVATVTLAELYADQGYDEQALAVYHRILQIDPHNDAAKRGVAALGTMTADSTTGAT